MAKKKDTKVIVTRIGVTKKFTFVGLDKKEYTLTEQQKRFAELYIDPFISGTQAVIKAGYDVYKDGKLNANLARSMATENLTKPAICQYITLIMEDAGLNDEIVNKHLLFNITQFDDLKAKNTAIDIYNKMKRKYGDPSGLPPINPPQTKREEDLMFNLVKRISEHNRTTSSALSDS